MSGRLVKALGGTLLEPSGCCGAVEGAIVSCAGALRGLRDVRAQLGVDSRHDGDGLPRVSPDLQQSSVGQ